MTTLLGKYHTDIYRKTVTVILSLNKKGLSNNADILMSDFRNREIPAQIYT